MAIYFVSRKKASITNTFDDIIKKSNYALDVISFCCVLIIKINCTFDNLSYPIKGRLYITLLYNDVSYNITLLDTSEYLFLFTDAGSTKNYY